MGSLWVLGSKVRYQLVDQHWKCKALLVTSIYHHQKEINVFGKWRSPLSGSSWTNNENLNDGQRLALSHSRNDIPTVGRLVVRKTSIRNGGNDIVYMCLVKKSKDQQKPFWLHVYQMQPGSHNRIMIHHHWNKRKCLSKLVTIKENSLKLSQAMQIS